jgi:hypothetical protein
MATVSSKTSSTTYTLGTATRGPFLVGFRIFDAAKSALRVWINGVETSGYTVSATFANGYSDGAEITLNTSRPAGTKVTIESVTPFARQDNFVNDSPSLTRLLNIEQGRQAAVARDLRRDVDRAIKAAPGAEPLLFPLPEADRVLMWDDEGVKLTNGPSADEIANAATYAAQAQAAAAAAQAVSPNALTVDSLAALIANTTFTYTAGQPLTVVSGNTITTRQEGFSYEVRPSNATNQHITTAGGVKLRVRVQSSVVDLKAFNPNDTGAADTSTQFQAAIDLLAAQGGGTVFVPQGTFRINAQIALKTNVSVVSLGAALETGVNDSEIVTMFRGSGIAFAKVIGFEVRNTLALSTGQFVNLADCMNCEVAENRLVNFPASDRGSIRIGGTVASSENLIRENEITGSLGNAIALVGVASRNRVEGNYIKDCQGNGILLQDDARRNTLSRNRTDSNTGALIAIDTGCNHNIVEANHAEGCGVSGIIVIGAFNAVTGNHCLRNVNNGIRVSGSSNAVTGNVCIANAALGGQHMGIRVVPADGGCGQNNLIVGNVCDDNTTAGPTQYEAIAVEEGAYDAWAAGVAVTTGEYRVNGLRLFRAATTGTTGATAPTHGSGEASDGGVTWQRIETFEQVANVYGNVVMANRLGRSVNGAGLISQQDPEYDPVEKSHGTFKFGRGIVLARREVTASATVSDDDYIIAVRSTSACTITLPLTTRLAPGRALIIKNELGATSGTITISGNGNLINGSATALITQSYGEARLYWASDRWIAS